MIHRLSTAAAPVYPTLIWIGGVAFCVLIALASLPRLAWAEGLPSSSKLVAVAKAQPNLAPAPAPRPARVRVRCTTCGVVEAIRRIEPVGTQPAAYEFTVRLRDRSARVSTVEGSVGPWLVGDGIMLIGGDKPSSQTPASL
jgi:hypothetical protein